MDKATRRAAAVAADKLLAAAGYDSKGLTLNAAEMKRRAIRQANKTQTMKSQKAAGKRKRQAKR